MPTPINLTLSDNIDFLVDGTAKVDQDLLLVVRQSTSSKARIDQELELVVNQPTSSKARIDQEVILSVNEVTSSKARVLQQVILLIIQNQNAPINLVLSDDLNAIKPWTDALTEQLISGQQYMIAFAVT